MAGKCKVLSGSVNTSWGPRLVDTNQGLRVGPENTDLGARTIDTNWGPRSVNANCWSESGTGARNQGQGQELSKEPGAKKYKDPDFLHYALNTFLCHCFLVMILLIYYKIHCLYLPIFCLVSAQILFKIFGKHQ